MTQPDLLRCALPEPDAALAERARHPRLQSFAVAALAEARARPSHATPILADSFRAARHLGARDRPVVSEAVYGVIRHEALLDRAGARSDAERVAGWADLCAGDRFEALQSQEPSRDLATALSLPEAVAAEWLAQLGAEEAAALGAALGGRAPVTVRANRARCDREALAARLAAEGVQSSPCPAVPDGLTLARRVNAPSLQSFRDGWFEVQDEASQRLIEALLPFCARGERGPDALDLCAGAGGKALALAARGLRVQATDPRSHALQALGERARRAGLSEKIRVGPPVPAPLVLVDAPCSGTGRLRREPALRWGLEPSRWPPLQQQVLAQGAALVKPGGVLAYATCSLLRAENEQTPPGDWTLLEEQILWPHRSDTDGFGWRIWRRG